MPSARSELLALIAELNDDTATITSTLEDLESAYSRALSEGKEEASPDGFDRALIAAEADLQPTPGIVVVDHDEIFKRCAASSVAERFARVGRSSIWVNTLHAIGATAHRSR